MTVSGDGSSKKKGPSSLYDILTIIACDPWKCIDSRVLSKICSSCQSWVAIKETDRELYQSVLYTYDFSKNQRESSRLMKASSIVEYAMISESKREFRTTFF